jgi:hypothetical protein
MRCCYHTLLTDVHTTTQKFLVDAVAQFYSPVNIFHALCQSGKLCVKSIFNQAHDAHWQGTCHGHAPGSAFCPFMIRS